MRFMKLKRLWKLTVAVFFLVIGALTLLISKKNMKPIYRGLKFFLETDAYQITLKKLKADPEFKALMDEKYMQYKPVPWDDLAKLPKGSLGHEFAKFMNNPSVTDLKDLPEAKVEIDAETDYIRGRIRLVHDIHHVICGFPATEIGEMGISAFYVAQINSPLNSILLAVGLIKCTAMSPTRLPELMNVITQGYQSGLKARNLFGGRWEEIWEMPISQVRADWRIEASDLDFVSIPCPLQDENKRPA
jgi:ubiquinone biosynthesis protein COQ4